MSKAMLLLIMLALLSGCVTYEANRRQNYVDTYDNSMTPEIRRCVLGGKIMTGMTKDQVRASWGEPNTIDKTVTVFGVSEIWDYRYDTYLFFENNRLSSWHTTTSR